MIDRLSKARRRFIERSGALLVAKVVGPAALASSAQAQSSASKQKTLTWVVSPEPPGLVAAFSSAAMVQQVSPKILEGLVVYDAKLEPKPGLALAWSMSESGDSLTFKLRPGVRWHDGKPFTSADVKFTVEEVLKKYHPRGRTTFANVSAVETPDPLTAVFKLSTASPYIMSALAAAESPIVPKHLLTGSDPTKSRFNLAPVGTGPFRFEKWERGTFLSMIKNADYWDKGKPRIDRLITRFIPDASARAVALETGEVDIGGVFPVALDDTVRFQSSPTCP